MKVNDGGTATFFAVLKKSSADQKARIEKKAVEKKEAKKAEEKKAEKKEKQDKLKEAQQTSDDDDTITISAGSIEELIKKINDYTFSMKSDNVQTEAELQVGQHIDKKRKKSLYSVQKGFRKYRKSFLCTGKLGSHYKKRSVGMHDIRFAHRNDLWYNKDCRAKRV